MHSVVVLAVVAGTARSRPIARQAIDPGIVVFPPQPAPPVPQPIALPPDLDVPELTEIVPGVKDFAPGLVPALPGDTVTPWRLATSDRSASSEGEYATSDPLTFAQVDETPELLTAGVPRYPEILRAAGVTGRVVVEAVVDTLGRAERGSLRVVQSTHPGFNAGALAYVAGARFRPGRVLGRAVPVRVSVPIDFRITR